MTIRCTERLLLAAGLLAAAALAPAASCGHAAEETTTAPPPRQSAAEPADDPYRALRDRMVERDIAARGVSDPAVLEAMRRVPRHRFVPEGLVRSAYDDHPLPIGLRQTISQPYIVALMTELARVSPTDRVLEIGTGSGYQAAVLSVLAEKVYSIEILEDLSRRAAGVLQEVGADNVELRVGDGYRGWPEEAPFDAIVVTAAPPHIPEPLVEQLAEGGRMVIPVGTTFQELLVLERTARGVVRQRSIPVRFVPMTGEAQE
jgi:protein-L-isoaspartate(D-aspartate) O-methyltransferase